VSLSPLCALRSRELHDLHSVEGIASFRPSMKLARALSFQQRRPKSRSRDDVDEACGYTDASESTDPSETGEDSPHHHRASQMHPHTLRRKTETRTAHSTNMHVSV
jgi:hypothetical protein